MPVLVTAMPWFCPAPSFDSVPVIAVRTGDALVVLRPSPS
jgi:hypothetical protein